MFDWLIVCCLLAGFDPSFPSFYRCLFAHFLLLNVSSLALIAHTSHTHTHTHSLHLTWLHPSHSDTHSHCCPFLSLPRRCRSSRALLSLFWVFRALTLGRWSVTSRPCCVLTSDWHKGTTDGKESLRDFLFSSSPFFLFFLPFSFFLFFLTERPRTGKR